MTIYVTDPKQLKAPAWDKSGEKRVLMTKKDRERVFGPDKSKRQIIEDCIRYGVIPPQGVAKAKRVGKEPVGVGLDAIATSYAKLVEKNGSCKAIRMLAVQFKDVPVRTFIASLPKVSPSTIRIQFAKGRKGQV